MEKERLYVVHGMGPDAVGLVGQITAPVAQARGNIVDLRQDVLHGLFTFYLVVDLTDCDLSLEAFRQMLAEIGEETGLRISVDRYSPVARSPDKHNLLMILIGKDKPGIIASSSEMLAKYNANIEFAQTIGREGVFLMELLTDVSDTTIPVENLKRTISKNMQALNIKATFQDEHVFVKRKRILVFHITRSFIDRETFQEIITQTGLDAQQMRSAWAGKALWPVLQEAVARLDGLPFDTLDTLLESITPRAGSMELIQTLKVMGYKLVLVSNALSFLTDYLRKRVDLDHAFGVPPEVDDDARTICGELAVDESGCQDMSEVLPHLVEREGVDPDGITVITDEGCQETPGIRLDFNLDVLLGCINRRVITRENVLGWLASCGAPRWDDTLGEGAWMAGKRRENGH